MPRAPRSTLFPYTTLFRSKRLDSPGNGLAHARNFEHFHVAQELKRPMHVPRIDPLHLRRSRAQTTDQLMGAVPHLARNFDRDRKSTRLNSSHMSISYAVFC